MKTTIIASATGLLLLAGCGAPAPSGGQPSSAVTQQTTSEEARASITVSREATCQTLIGTDGGLISESGQFLIDVSELSDSTAKEATGIAQALKGVAETSGEEFKDLLTVMQEPFEDIAEAHRTGSDFSLDPTRYKAAGNEVIAICNKVDTPEEAEAGTADTGTSYADVEEMRAAFVTAGGVCEDFVKPEPNDRLIDEVGKCRSGSGTVWMYRFADKEKRDEFIQKIQKVAPVANLPINFIVGDLWIIDSPDAAALAADLGGTLVTE